MVVKVMDVEVEEEDGTAFKKIVSGGICFYMRSVRSRAIESRFLCERFVFWLSLSFVVASVFGDFAII